MITFDTITRNYDGSWTFDWTTTGAGSYRIVLEGSLLVEILGPPYVFRGSGYPTDPPALEVTEVTEDTDLADSELYQPYMVIQWYRNLLAKAYSVEKYDGSNWVGFKVVQEKGKAGAYRVRTLILPDESTDLFRVRCVDSLEEYSVPIEYNAFIVCPPQFAPTEEVVIDYDPGTTSVTVGAA